VISKVSHIGVCVSDLERSIRFYCDVLGFVRSETMSDVHVEGEPSDTLLKLRDVKLDAVYLERDGFRLELLHYERPRSPSRAPERSMNTSPCRSPTSRQCSRSSMRSASRSTARP
jgi:catechol 2,3-dioxygenase-like lactoylglutathione lyase family enzyme